MSGFFAKWIAVVLLACALAVTGCACGCARSGSQAFDEQGDSASQVAQNDGEDAPMSADEQRAAESYGYQSVAGETREVLKQGGNTLDRDRMKSVAVQFVQAYYQADSPARTQALEGLVNLDATAQDQDSVLYQDYYQGRYKPDSTYVSNEVPVIDNAQDPDGTVRLVVNLRREYYWDSGALAQVDEYSQIVQVKMDGSYRVTELVRQQA